MHGDDTGGIFPPTLISHGGAAQVPNCLASDYFRTASARKTQSIFRDFPIGRRSWRELGQARRQLDLALAREAGD